MTLTPFFSLNDGAKIWRSSRVISSQPDLIAVGNRRSISHNFNVYTEIYNEWAQGMALDLPEPLIGHEGTALKERKVLISGGKSFLPQKTYCRLPI